MFVDKKIAAGVIIPHGLQKSLDTDKPLKIEMLNSTSGNIDALIKPILQRAVNLAANDYRTAKIYKGNHDTGIIPAIKMVTNTRENSSVDISARNAINNRLKKSSTSTVGEAAVGFVVMFMMMMIFMMSGVILRERENGTWGRLLSTPSRKVEVTAGYIMSFVITGLFQFAILVTGTSLFFGIKWGPIGPLVALAVAFVLCASGMGLFLAGVVKTPEQQGSIGTIFVVSTSMLGGAFWPLDYVSPLMRKIGYLTPQAWAMDGFKDIMLRNGQMTNIVTPILILVSIALIFMSFGVLRIKYE
jgi:ABC-2 type transport system permease protein